MLPLRLFLGLTFLYAGFQKIADPSFLSASAPGSLVSQLKGYAVSSPIGFLLVHVAIPLGALTGVAVILTELLVGAGALLGVGTRVAAAVGALLNLTLFLTATWSVRPYFLGSDSIYAVAWLTLLAIGDQGVFTLPSLLRSEEDRMGRKPDPDRRRLVLGAGVAVAVLWLLAMIPRSSSPPRVAAVPSPAPTPAPSPTPSPSPTASATPAPTGSPSAAPAGERKVGTLAELRRQGGGLSFQDPAGAGPAIAVQLAGGGIVAYSAVCTHAGCLVQYDPGSRDLICPCHGSVFDPAHGATVLRGPAFSPLPAIRVTEGSNGDIYAR